MQVIKDGHIVQDDWLHLGDDQPLADRPCTLSCQRWLKERDALAQRSAALGIRLTGADALDGLGDDLARFDLVTIEFPAMADGRGFSLARLLRDRYGYRGEVRARGDFIRDQVFFLSRVGVNAFECREGLDPAELLAALTEFSVKYQTGADEAQPLYRRQARNT